MKIKDVEHLKMIETVIQNCGQTMEEYFLNRRKLEIGLADWERSQRQKQNWRENRWKYLHGIRKFHRSTKGKEFHNTLSRFLASRDTVSKLAYYQSMKDRERGEVMENNVSGSNVFDRVNFVDLEEYREFLIGITSAVTHALIEERYYEPDINEAVEYKLFLAYLLERYCDTLNKLSCGRIDEIDWDFWQMLVAKEDVVQNEGGM